MFYDKMNNMRGRAEQKSQWRQCFRKRFWRHHIRRYSAVRRVRLAGVTPWCGSHRQWRQS